MVFPTVDPPRVGLRHSRHLGGLHSIAQRSRSAVARGMAEKEVGDPRRHLQIRPVSIDIRDVNDDGGWKWNKLGGRGGNKWYK